MSNITRKSTRKHLTENKKQAEQALKTQVGMFGKLPNECTTCSAPFDKKSKEMAQTWSVYVSYEYETVKLFCPECFIRTKEKLENENKEA